MTTSRIVELARIIEKHTSTIDAALTARGLPTPSFDHSASVVLPPDLTPSYDAVLDATQELHDLLLSPMDIIQRKSCYNNMAGMKAISQYNIANCFVPGETVSYEKLSESCGLAVKPLKHLLRHAMTLRIFTEPTKGMVAHTAASKLMRDPNCMAWLETATHDLWPSCVKLVDGLVEWPNSEEPQHSGWNLAHNLKEPLYERLAMDSKLAARFGASMSAMGSNNPALAISHIERSHDWESLGNGLVVDVGGSHGAVAVELASKHKNLRFISQDLEATIDSAPPLPDTVADRVKLMVHDFFTPQPVEADAYIFRWIFHNWSDKYAAQILQALIPALKPGARILVQDGVLPEPRQIPSWREKDIRDMDLSMNVLFNAWERDVDEWKELFRRADGRFRFIGVTQPQGSALALIEARWSGGDPEELV
ncbi:sterigmatocystin 8-O-methyltransferase [Westerdykella ornata]|uniref:Sterigmatocystin 8-O-methyltransferase n=1 Tax=Westerdykella ornata TaxID=318751 RepID=A0A6A6J8J7_WESOR|nr:sterigmatocystin 8-O-methyltransferase [Westerdykella ornata]KAF2272524.1 sterigmatocystin 8-O-methyltransferase [Westerdykella ornata]